MQNNTQHTPGPWKAEGWKGIAVNSRDGDTIVVHPGGSSYAPLEELQANARLIAAAPDLLAALIELERVESSPHSETIRFLAREQARAAIAKATGEGKAAPLEAGRDEA